jgi:hypothetical protein
MPSNRYPNVPNGIFLMLISIAPIAKSIAGYHFIKYKDNLTKVINKLNLSLHFIALLTAPLMYKIGSDFHAPYIKYFGIFAVPALLIPHFYIFYIIKKKPQELLKKYYMRWHIEAMLSSAVPLHVAIISGGPMKALFPDIYHKSVNYIFIVAIVFEISAYLYSRWILNNLDRK